MFKDELTLVEGEIITIVSRVIEDAGWWRGELDGKVGVFPDNFVKVKYLLFILKGLNSMKA